MITYDLHCSCGYEEERVQSIKDDLDYKCPSCGGEMKQRYHVPTSGNLRFLKFKRKTNKHPETGGLRHPWNVRNRERKWV